MWISQKFQQQSTEITLRGSTDYSSNPRGAIDIQYDTRPTAHRINRASRNICGRSEWKITSASEWHWGSCVCVWQV